MIKTLKDLAECLADGIYINEGREPTDEELRILDKFGYFEDYLNR